MRLFAAIVPPPSVLDDIEAAIAPLRKDTSLRWSPRSMWHITCAFYGELDDSSLRMLRTRLEHCAESTTLGAIRVQNATEFNGRTLVLEVGGDTEQLARLAERCTAAGRAIGIEMEHRRYRPHLTIARAHRPRDLSTLVSALIGFRSDAWEPDELVFMQSVRGPEPRYAVVAAWPLSARGR